jgi:hypothetical protein
MRGKADLRHEGSYSSVEEVPGVAAAPLPVLVVEVATGEVACDGSNGEVGVAGSVSHSIREVVVLDPFRVSRGALWVQGDECRGRWRRKDRTHGVELPAGKDCRDRLCNGRLLGNTEPLHHAQYWSVGVLYARKDISGRSGEVNTTPLRFEWPSRPPQLAKVARRGSRKWRRTFAMILCACPAPKRVARRVLPRRKWKLKRRRR